jgi:hypothetical protein
MAVLNLIWLRTNYSKILLKPPPPIEEGTHNHPMGKTEGQE